MRKLFVIIPVCEWEFIFTVAFMQTAPLILILKSCQNLFSAVVPFSSGKDKLLLLDFTGSNTELTAEILQDTLLFD